MPCWSSISTLSARSPDRYNTAMTSGASEQSPGQTLDHVLFYDGECGMCDRSVSFVMQHDRNGTFYFAPLQGETAADRLDSQHTRDIKSVVYERNAKVWTHSAAVVRVLWDLGGIWTLAGVALWLIPAPVRDFCYRSVARVRHRLFPKKETCRMASTEERARILP